MVKRPTEGTSLCWPAQAIIDVVNAGAVIQGDLVRPVGVVAVVVLEVNTAAALAGCPVLGVITIVESCSVGIDVGGD